MSAPGAKPNETDARCRRFVKLTTGETLYEVGPHALLSGPQADQKLKEMIGKPGQVPITHYVFGVENGAVVVPATSILYQGYEIVDPPGPTP